VGDGLAGQIVSALKQLTASNQLKGIILDLRFADGHDYAAAAAAADLFVSREMPLLDWGSGSSRSKAKSDAITLPLAVLVNHQTAGAAEALAAVLRDDCQAMILSTTTAGDATIGREFPLKNGQSLSIATPRSRRATCAFRRWHHAGHQGYGQAGGRKSLLRRPIQGVAHSRKFDCRIRRYAGHHRRRDKPCGACFTYHGGRFNPGA
jgi:hypothetical protein